MAYLDSREIA
jgi:hypothetical protein